MQSWLSLLLFLFSFFELRQFPLQRCGQIYILDYYVFFDFVAFEKLTKESCQTALLSFLLFSIDVEVFSVSDLPYIKLDVVLLELIVSKSWLDVDKKSIDQLLMLKKIFGDLQLRRHLPIMIVFFHTCFTFVQFGFYKSTALIILNTFLALFIEVDSM